MPKVNVPNTIDQISEDWLKTALDARQFINLSKKRIGQEFGFASEIYHLSWDEGLNHKSAVIKLWDTKAAGSHEVAFYRSCQLKNCRIPHCFFSQLDENSKRGVLILEDLSEAEQGDVLKPVSENKAHLLGQNLAGLHAQFMGIERGSSGLNLWRSSPPSADWIESRRIRFLERFPDQLKGTSLKLLNQLEFASLNAYQKLAESPKTLIHGDFHLDNILFLTDQSPVVLDWSKPLIGPLEVNLAAFLFDMVPKTNFEHVLYIYVEQLNSLGKMAIKKADLIDRLGPALIFKFMEATCGIAQWEPSTTRGKKIIQAMIKNAESSIQFWEKKQPNCFSFLFSKK